MKSKLLIVDDEELIVENLRFLLEGASDEVFIALNGKEAFDIIVAENITCVVSDVNMPVMDGVELLKLVRGRNIEVPFIFFTGHGNEALKLEAKKFGAFDFVDKPNFDELEAVVRKGIAQRD